MVQITVSGSGFRVAGHPPTLYPTNHKTKPSVPRFIPFQAENYKKFNDKSLKIAALQHTPEAQKKDPKPNPGRPKSYKQALGSKKSLQSVSCGGIEIPWFRFC